MSDYRVCVRCIMDTSEPDIIFDDQGVCNHCRAADLRLAEWVCSPGERKSRLLHLVERIKEQGRNKSYDCIIGVSGGIDSTAVAYHAKKLGLRPLAVHFDNGWNSELAVDNITRTLKQMDIDLFTYVVDWEEFKDLQLSFLKAGVVNCEAPTDHGITATLFRTAAREKVRYILSGSNLATEAIMPITWSYYNQDLRNLNAIHRRFGHSSLQTFPTLSMTDYLFNVFIRGIRQVPFLNYFEYDKEASKKILATTIGWRDYGGKHYESIWTRFYQGYYLPTKFGFDKRRAHLSTMICSGLITREQALSEMENPAYPPELFKQDMDYVRKKFALTQDELQELMQIPNHSHTDYPSNYFWFHTLKRYKNIFRKIATSA